MYDVLVGKSVGGYVYTHVSALKCDPAALQIFHRALEMASSAGYEVCCDVVRRSADASEVALLHYPGFFEEAFPRLLKSWRVQMVRGAVSYRTYEGSLNPPILHRKELLLSPDDPRRSEYAALTEAAEMVGLFDEPTRIGYERQWKQLVTERGYRVVGHQLLLLGNEEGSETDGTLCGGSIHDGWQAARELTAMVRYGFSAPVQSLEIGRAHV